MKAPMRRARINQAQHQYPPWPVPTTGAASCFRGHVAALKLGHVLGWRWPPACPWLRAVQENLPSTAPELLPPCAAVALGLRHGDAWARRAASDCLPPAILKLLYSDSVLLPCPFSRAAAHRGLARRCFCCPCSQPSASCLTGLTRWPVGSGAP